MNNNSTAELYRPNVGIALFNNRGLVWIGRRTGELRPHPGKFLWQMPQGGIDEGEEPEAAAYRELREETGIESAKIIGRMNDWITYDFPPAVRENRKDKLLGQRQLWFAMRFLGSENEINLQTETPEFDDWQWSDLREVEPRVVEFKRAVYRKVLQQFEDLAKLT